MVGYILMEIHIPFQLKLNTKRKMKENKEEKEVNPKRQ